MSRARFGPLPLCRLIVRIAGLLVPQAVKEDWAAEWSSELWHVWHSCGHRKLPEVFAFCLGAFQDAYWLRRNQLSVIHRPFLNLGSPARCLVNLSLATGLSFLIAFCVSGPRQALVPSPYPDSQRLVVISSSGFWDSPTIPLADFRSWQTSTRHLFTDVAFYQPMQKRVHLGPHKTAELTIVRATSNLFPLLNISDLVPAPANRSQHDMPTLLLAESTWRTYFAGHSDVVGRVVTIGGRYVRIAGVLSPDRWRLPGAADGWMVADEYAPETMGLKTRGFVVAHLRASAFSRTASGKYGLSVPRQNGDIERFDCVSIAYRDRQPFSIFLFTLLVACLALPATTPLPLGEYPARPERLPQSVRIRRWLFLASKLLLILPLVYSASLDLAYGFPGVHPLHSQYLQLSTSFFGLLFAFRWALRDQRSRCPVCLRLLTNPAHVGEVSRNFLAWNGTELICSGGHGLLHIPEIPTSWFSTQRWLYLDSSWSGLFTDPCIVPAVLR